MTPRLPASRDVLDDWCRRVVESVQGGVHRLVAGGRRLGPLTRDRRVRAGGAVMLIAALAIVADVVVGTPGVREIRGIGNLPVATTVFDRHDEPAFTIFDERRFVVPLVDISPHLVAAVLAVEDQRFYEHGGIDVWRIGGAALANLREVEWVQGGSTITQQLARLSFLTPEKSLRRKIREAYLAVRIERQFEKHEILEVYLNKVYFGAGLYGAEAAARGYFGKSAAELSIAEAALLAGLVQAPSAYAPTSHPDRAQARRAVVLERMADAGAIDRETAVVLAAEPIAIDWGFAHEQTGAYFKAELTQALVAEYGWETVARGGLRVYSTYDPVAQRAAEAALADGLTRIESSRAFRHPTRDDLDPPADGQAPGYLQGAVVAIDPRDGGVRALVGGRDFTESQFNRATQARRQAGSAFKPFVYAAALEMGYSPATLVTGLDRPIPTPEGPWLPADGHADVAAMTMRTALRTSSNRAAAQVLQAVGVRRAVSHAESLGMTAPPVPSLVLGSGGVTPLALTTAYAAFANGGWLQTPHLVRRVEDPSGAVLSAPLPAPRRVVSEATAYQMAQMLADVVNRGTGWRVRQAGFRKHAAGKTGTTNDYHDAWFVGFTPSLVASVWVGFDAPKPITANGYAGDLAAPIWGRFMAEAATDDEDDWLARPSDVVAVEICTESGLRPGSGCRRVARENADGESSIVSAVGIEFFRRGTAPEATCPLHGYSWWYGARLDDFDPSDFRGVTMIGRPGSNGVGVRTAEVDRRGERGRDDGARRGLWSRLLRAIGGGG